MYNACVMHDTLDGRYCGPPLDLFHQYRYTYVYVCVCVPFYVKSVSCLSPNNSWDRLLQACDQITHQRLSPTVFDVLARGVFFLCLARSDRETEVFY